jgi:pimeloyl-ACP methyl ester carboxylesterase
MSLPPTQPLKPWRPKFFRDYGWADEPRLEDRWTEVQGRPLFSRSSRRAGTTPFVLVHGLIISSLAMIPLAEVLAEEHEVHALDLPGFGRSQGPSHALSMPELAGAIVDWMSAAGLERCHLVGHSLGCQIAAHVGANSPERLASLTLIAPTIDADAHDIVIQALRLLADLPHESLGLWPDMLVDIIRAGPRRIVETIRLMFADFIERQLPRITTPTLIVTAGGDPISVATWAERIARSLPDPELCTLPGTRHCVHYSQPEQVAERLAAFLRHLEDRRAPGSF